MLIFIMATKATRTQRGHGIIIASSLQALFYMMSWLLEQMPPCSFPSSTLKTSQSKLSLSSPFT